MVGRGELETAGRILREGDRVVQTVNDYGKDVFNGDVGRVLAVNPVEKRLSVDFDGRVVGYKAFELEALTWTYAITIHSSQGSEFPTVVVPVLNSHGFPTHRGRPGSRGSPCRGSALLVAQRVRRIDARGLDRGQDGGQQREQVRGQDDDPDLAPRHGQGAPGRDDAE